MKRNKWVVTYEPIRIDPYSGVREKYFRTKKEALVWVEKNDHAIENYWVWKDNVSDWLASALVITLAALAVVTLIAMF